MNPSSKHKHVGEDNYLSDEWGIDNRSQCDQDCDQDFDASEINIVSEGQQVESPVPATVGGDPFPPSGEKLSARGTADEGEKVNVVSDPVVSREYPSVDLSYSSPAQFDEEITKSTVVAPTVMANTHQQGGSTSSRSSVVLPPPHLSTWESVDDDSFYRTPLPVPTPAKEDFVELRSTRSAAVESDLEFQDYLRFRHIQSSQQSSPSMEVDTFASASAAAHSSSPSDTTKEILDHLTGTVNKTFDELSCSVSACSGVVSPQSSVPASPGHAGDLWTAELDILGDSFEQRRSSTTKMLSTPVEIRQDKSPIQIRRVDSDVCLRASSTKYDIIDLSPYQSIKVDQTQSLCRERLMHPQRYPASGARPEEFEEDSKITVFVLHKGVKTPVSWWKDTSPRDVQEAVLCACDSIANSGFHLRELLDINTDEVNVLSKQGEDRPGGKLLILDVDGARACFKRGRIYEYEDFENLVPNRLYSLELSNERAELLNIVGNRWRSFTIEIDPFLHIEVQRSVKKMKEGTNLLKHTSTGQIHLRQFQLTPNCSKLVWYSARKSRDASQITISKINEIRVGQNTPTFKRVALPDMAMFSFSLISSDQQCLDLTAKNREEFDTWMTGLKGLCYWSRGKLINKFTLLGHSQSFREYIAQRDPVFRAQEEKLKNKIKSMESQSMEKYANIPMYSKKELKLKWQAVSKRHLQISQTGETLRNQYYQSRAASSSSSDNTAAINNAALQTEGTQTDDENDKTTASTANCSGGVTTLTQMAALFVDDSAPDDIRMEINRMGDLLAVIYDLLEKIRVYVCDDEDEGREISLNTTETDADTETSQSRKAGKDSDHGDSTTVSVAAATKPPGSSGGVVDLLVDLDDNSDIGPAPSSRVLTSDSAVSSGGKGAVSSSSSSSSSPSRPSSSAKTETAKSGKKKSSKSSSSSGQTAEDEGLNECRKMLWQAEVEVENVEDIQVRIQRSLHSGGSSMGGASKILVESHQKLVELNNQVANEFSKWGSQVKQFFSTLQIPSGSSIVAALTDE